LYTPQENAIDDIILLWRQQSENLQPNLLKDSFHRTRQLHMKPTDPVEGAKAAAPAMRVATMASFMVNTLGS